MRATLEPQAHGVHGLRRVGRRRVLHGAGRPRRSAVATSCGSPSRRAKGPKNFVDKGVPQSRGLRAAARERHGVRRRSPRRPAAMADPVPPAPADEPVPRAVRYCRPTADAREIKPRWPPTPPMEPNARWPPSSTSRWGRCWPRSCRACSAARSRRGARVDQRRAGAGRAVRRRRPPGSRGRMIGWTRSRSNQADPAGPYMLSAPPYPGPRRVRLRSPAGRPGDADGRGARVGPGRSASTRVKLRDGRDVTAFDGARGALRRDRGIHLDQGRCARSSSPSTASELRSSASEALALAVIALNRERLVADAADWTIRTATIGRGARARAAG